jgi:hypothetical protein
MVSLLFAGTFPPELGYMSFNLNYTCNLPRNKKQEFLEWGEEKVWPIWAIKKI